MNTISLGDEYDAEPMSKDMLEYICDGSQYYPSINKIKARYKIHDHIKPGKMEYKGALSSMRNMGKGLQKLFKAVVNDIFQDLPILGEPGSEVSYFIPEPIFFRSDHIIRRRQ